jgi:hypothetical protein
MVSRRNLAALEERRFPNLYLKLLKKSILKMHPYKERGASWLDQ